VKIIEEERRKERHTREIKKIKHPKTGFQLLPPQSITE